GVDLDVSKLFAQPTLDDFRALRLERVEEAVLASLGADFSSEYLSGVRGAKRWRCIIGCWSMDADGSA
ncbi:MAG TPA: hypothetical protein VF627_10180, partial [Abditibacterium sp.]